MTLPALGFDPTPPQVALREPDPDDPLRIRVKASDATSGIARGEVELRRRGRNTWHSLATQLNPAGFSALVDDEALGDGVYDVRVRATDRAGNEASASTRPGGRPATVVLPLRVKTRLAVGKVRRSHRRSRVRRSLVRRPSIGFGRSARLHGRLTMPGGNPIPDADIDVWERIALPDSAWRRVASVRTSRTGRFTFKAVRGPSRLLRFRYAGTPTIRARTSLVDLRVRASSSLQVNRHRLVNGEDVTFHGRVRGRRTLPAREARRAPGLHKAPLADVRPTDERTRAPATGRIAIASRRFAAPLASASERDSGQRPGSRTSWAPPGASG